MRPAVCQNAQNAFGGRALPGPLSTGRAYSAPPDLLAGFKGRGGKGRERLKGMGREVGMEKEKGVKGGKRRGRERG